jgi:hypothetical protein
LWKSGIFIATFAVERENNGIRFRVYRDGNHTLVFWDEGAVICVLVSLKTLPPSFGTMLTRTPPVNGRGANHSPNEPPLRRERRARAHQRVVHPHVEDDAVTRTSLGFTRA